ncbi:MAG: stage II sporulation protein P, partial [Oscillospiraceae bacterium]|nr:stage II sporulation protein P [Oscillospiraceae bacterium]
NKSLAATFAIVLSPLAVVTTVAPTPAPVQAIPLLNPYTHISVNNGEMLLSEYVYTPSTPPASAPTAPTRADNGAPVITRNLHHDAPTQELTPRTGRITTRTFRPAQSGHYISLPGGGQVRNSSEHSDALLLRTAARPLSFTPALYENSGQPQVLIIHTHTTESFANISNTYRTTDPQRNIVAVGAAAAEEIAAAGFGVVHDATLHDYPAFSGAYSRSAATIREILAEYPSIRIVLDIHRDAIESGGVPVAPVANIARGEQAAQIMIISAADDSGNWNVPDYMENFKFTTRLQTQLEQDNPGITRALWFTPCNYNMNSAPGAMLVEIGGHGNTLEQALLAGRLFGQSMGNLLNSLALESV